MVSGRTRYTLAGLVSRQLNSLAKLLTLNAPINVMPAGGGGGRAWGGDLTFFKNLQSHSLLMGKSFQSNAK